MRTESDISPPMPAGKAKHSATISGWSEALGLPVVLLVGIVIWSIPSPAGVQPKAWHLLAIFVATIIGIIGKPLPMGAIALLGIAATALSGTLTINQALSGFGNSTIWPCSCTHRQCDYSTGGARRFAHNRCVDLERHSRGRILSSGSLR
jgi:sodium:sulfate symporter-like transmembrane protein